MRDDTLVAEMYLAEERAWKALARYKFMMFGYWAAIWVHLNAIGEFHRPNPFHKAVLLARDQFITEIVAAND